MKHELLRILIEMKDTYVSGQQLSERLGVSRTAVWKHMEDLRREGYVIDAVPRKGYQLKERPNTLSEAEIKAGLPTKSIGQTTIYKPTVTSTQSVAKEAYRAGTPHGTAVVASEQSGGRGRMERLWQSPDHTSISVSIIVKPDISISEAPQLTLVAAVAVAEALAEVTELSAQIKWPNDIYINDRKVAGVLTEMQAESDRMQMMIVGIGLNINQRKDHFPGDLQEKATSLRMESGREWSRANILQALFVSFEKWYGRWLANGFKDIRTAWDAYALLYKKPIKVVQGNKSIHGHMLGIDNEGILQLQDQDGEVHAIYSGDLES
ncbi:biotin--[acetyl-CoA-carboxylase] ligase [Natribacillus halophilus]|uniref:Bifunctional ligase/repressor BirA n=1 Tax=Natribacillus halophilus TaxID=549003 RepID=A0A1G8JB44_9BACI|nr:biotin--[acetyl-CoA-carboxylase] ligase [Natribacillus halophilus]SDI28207.1 BirA family transcriptional regulator, biotin operon repressor / biotin-[acetyl-CoA-carboxylase] ligase [Natribacillus halophilus]